jgi:hypothetical protein
MTQTTGFGKGRPSKFDLTITDNPLKMFLDSEKSLDVAIADAIKASDWLGEADQGSALLAIHLAKQLMMQENRTHQIAPVLISLLGNLGLLYGSRQQEKTDLVDDFLSELRANEVATN